MFGIGFMRGRQQERRQRAEGQPVARGTDVEFVEHRDAVSHFPGGAPHIGGVDRGEGGASP